MSLIERADADRIKMTVEDRAKYTGVIRHPLARRHLLGKLIEARECAALAIAEEDIQRHNDDAERITAELAKGGYVVGESR